MTDKTDEDNATRTQEMRLWCDAWVRSSHPYSKERTEDADRAVRDFRNRYPRSETT